MRRLAIVSLVVLLTACGFHLRGMGPGGSLPYEKVTVAGTGAVADRLRDSLKLDKRVTLLPNKTENTALIEILGERTDRKIGALNNDGRVAEYRLTLAATYRATQPDGTVLVAESTVEQHRDYTYDEGNALGNESQERILYRDMQQMAAQRILREIIARDKAMKGALSQ
ncbi:LPS-assembly lipoprotein LptE [Chitinibacteraceae bacterium HSL-7]